MVSGEPFDYKRNFHFPFFPRSMVCIPSFFLPSGYMTYMMPHSVQESVLYGACISFYL